MSDEKQAKPKVATGESKAIEAWAKELETPDWLFAAAKSIRKWGEGKELSKSDFEAAVDQAANLKCNA